MPLVASTEGHPKPTLTLKLPALPKYRSIPHGKPGRSAIVVDDQRTDVKITHEDAESVVVHLPVPAALKRAGLKKPKSSRLWNSWIFGSRQAPATLASERPQLPLARALAASSACCQD
jgi:hypothetical protein